MFLLREMHLLVFKPGYRDMEHLSAHQHFKSILSMVIFKRFCRKRDVKTIIDFVLVLPLNGINIITFIFVEREDTMRCVQGEWVCPGVLYN